eukprot:951491_1
MIICIDTGDNECETSRRLFGEMFNIELSEDTAEITYSGDNTSYAYDARNDTEDGVGYTLVWSRYIFFSLAQLGLTASAAIQDPLSGDLYGVVGIDYRHCCMTRCNKMNAILRFVFDCTTMVVQKHLINGFITSIHCVSRDAT